MECKWAEICEGLALQFLVFDGDDAISEGKPESARSRHTCWPFWAYPKEDEFPDRPQLRKSNVSSQLLLHQTLKTLVIDYYRTTNFCTVHFQDQQLQTRSFNLVLCRAEYYCQQQKLVTRWRKPYILGWQPMSTLRT